MHNSNLHFLHRGWTYMWICLIALLASMILRFIYFTPLNARSIEYYIFLGFKYIFCLKYSQGHTTVLFELGLCFVEFQDNVFKVGKCGLHGTVLFFHLTNAVAASLNLAHCANICLRFHQWTTWLASRQICLSTAYNTDQINQGVKMFKHFSNLLLNGFEYFFQSGSECW